MKTPKYILIPSLDKSLEPVLYRVKEILWETTNTLTLDVEGKGVFETRKKKARLFHRRPYGWGNPRDLK